MRSEADASRARADQEHRKTRLYEVKRATKLASAIIDDVWKQSVELDKAAVVALQQLTETSSRAQFSNGELCLLKKHKWAGIAKSAMTQLVHPT